LSINKFPFKNLRNYFTNMLVILHCRWASIKDKSEAEVHASFVQKASDIFYTHTKKT